MSCWGVVLAAGASRRFGNAKLTAPLRGRPLLEHSLKILAEATGSALLSGVVVVHRPGDHAVIRLAQAHEFTPVEAIRSERGLGESLRAGLAALLDRPEPEGIDGALIVPGDQPLVRVEVIQQVLGEASKRGAPVVRPAYAEQPGVPGHPVWLARSAWGLLDSAEPDRGMAAVIAAHGLPVATVRVSGANPDVDTPDQLTGLEQRGA